MSYRILYKMLLIVYKTINNQGPVYLKDLLEYRISRRSLRSNNDKRLVEPVYRLESFGARSFMCAAPRLWNSLPLQLRGDQPGTDEYKKLSHFKKALKSHLFTKAYYAT